MKQIKTIEPVQEINNKFNNEKVRVAVYVRVSTKSIEQEGSFEMQKDAYINMIKKIPNWKLVGIYWDYGKSGLSQNNRAEFNKMIKKALRGKIDLIITKSVSRFSRNTLDVLEIINKLSEKGVDVWFEKENIKISEQKGEVLISVISAFVQEESRNISENIKWGFKRKFERGDTFKKYKRFYGFSYVDDEMVIVPEEAKVVRKIFDLYLSGKTLNQIKAYLESNNIKNSCGGDIWYTATIDDMLSNEKYAGDSIMQKTYVEDYLTKRKLKNRGQKEQYYVRNSHQGNISREIFEETQNEKERRKRIIYKSDGSKEYSKTKYRGKYDTGNILVCGYCGAGFRRRTERGKVVWRCATRVEKGRNVCQESPTLKNKEIIDKNLRAYDFTATIFCMDNNIKTYAFALKDPMNIYRVINGENVGTETHN